MKKIYYASFIYVIIGMALGVFNRAFTVANDFKGYTSLSVAHTHVLILGFFFFLVILILAKLFNIHKAKGFTAWFAVYNVSFIMMIFALCMRGVYDIIGGGFSGLIHIAATSHTLMLVVFIWLFVILRKPVMEADK